jgi:hypothetical protein
MMQKLLKQAVSNDILILNQQTVTSFVDKGVAVEVVLNDFLGQRKLDLNTLTGVAVKPARAQVLITEPIENLDIRELFIWIGAIIILKYWRQNIGWWSEFRFRRRKYNRVCTNRNRTK